MNQQLRILQSKVLQPECGHTLHRKRLVERLCEVSRKKLALVVAGAGYGKTTLVAQTVEALGTPVVWYNLDDTDRDLYAFLAYLVAGIRKHKPDFGEDLDKRLAVSTSSQRVRRALLLAFLGAFEKEVNDDLLFVLDDFHAMEKDEEVIDALQFMLERSTRRLHWILVSRRDPPLKLSRYRAMADVVDIEETDLAFRSDEVETLFRGLLQVDIDTASLEKLFERTGGWAVGLMLFHNALQTSAPTQIKASLFEIGRTRRLVFQYLEENIFDNQPPATREFMLRSSLMSRLDPDFCDAVLQTTASREILSNLSDHHLLTFPSSDADHTFHYHQLLREFLRDKLLRTHGKAAVNRLHRDIGRGMEKADNLHGALQHYLKGRHFTDICRIFEGMVISDFMKCPFRFIIDIFENIPAGILRKHPRMLYMAAKLTAVGGEVQQSLEGFRTALSQFEALGDVTGILTCQKELGFHYYLTGDIERAKRQMQQLWGQRHEDVFFPAEIAGFLILFCSILGEMEEADVYYHRAGRISDLSQLEKRLVRAYLDFCYAYRLHSAGNFARADAMNRQSLEIFTQIGMEPLLPLAYFQTALTLFFLRQSDAGCDHAQKGLSLARELGIFDAQYAWLCYVDGLNRLGIGDLDGAQEAAEEALEIFIRQQHPWGQAAVYELFGMHGRGRNDNANAERFFRKTLQVLAGRAFPVAAGSAVVGLAETLADENQDNAAEELLARHRQEIGISTFHQFRFHLVMANLLLRSQKTTAAVHEFSAALRLARDNRYEAWLVGDLTRLAPLLVACHSAGVMESYTQKLLRQAGYAFKESLRVLKKDKGAKDRRAVHRLLDTLSPEALAPLDIRCLGAFAVSVGGTSIPDNQWKNSKAKKIFQYLALRQEQGFVPKDVLLELAWPEEDTVLTNRRFHVAMTFLRKLLEPRLKRGASSNYIVRQNDGYRLAIGDAGRIDVGDFLRSLSTAQSLEQKNDEAALDQYLKAAELYRGPLFVEAPYDEGFAEEREMLQAKYLSALEKIVRGFEKQGAWDRCIEFAERYLTIEPFAEGIYCDLMRYHFCRSEPSRIAAVFERCKTRINEDLGFALQPGTESLFRELTGGTERRRA